MSATDRLQSERHHHDEQARARRAHFSQHPEELLLDEDQYLDHETWLRPGIKLLGDVCGKCVLDYGCGHGMAAVLLAKRGAVVTAFDLSAWYVDEATARARANGMAERVRVLQASAEALPFADQSFDAVWGNAILHHLDLDRAGAELARVLKPDGVAVFCEPWGENPLLEWARRRLPYPGKDRSRDERPLCKRDLIPLRRHFRDVQFQPHQLLTMARRVWPKLPLQGALQRADEVLFARIPSLRRWCRYVVLTLRRPAGIGGL
jgi:SAM-dependent methyltransferase